MVWRASVPTRVLVATPGQRRLCLFGHVSVHIRQEVCQVVVGIMLTFLLCPGEMLASRLRSGTRLWGFCTLFALLPGSHDQGAVGGAGRLRPLGAPLPEIDPQKYRGRPMGPFTPCDSFWDHLLVYCKDPVSPQRFCSVTQALQESALIAWCLMGGG